MNTRPVAALVLIILGVVILAYAAITWTLPGQSAGFLGMQFETTDGDFIPPVLGAIALIGGLVLLAGKPNGLDRKT